MSVPKSLFASALLLAVTSIATAAQVVRKPQITTTEPQHYMAIGQGTDGPLHGRISIQLRGVQLAAPDTSGRTFSKDVEVFMRRDARDWSRVVTEGNSLDESVASWGPARISVQFVGDKWLRDPGYIQFKVVVRGVESDVYSVDVVPRSQRPPVIRKVNQTSPFLTTRQDDHDWGFRLLADNLTPAARLLIDGQVIRWEYLDPVSNLIDASIPKALRNNPGRHSMQVQTELGKSALWWVDITAPPAIVRLVPADMMTARAGGTTPGGQPRLVGAAPVVVHFTGSVPSEVAVRADGGPWRMLKPSATSDGKLTLLLPAAYRDKPASVEIRLTNAAGEATATLAVHDSPKLAIPPQPRARLPAPQRVGDPISR